MATPGTASASASASELGRARRPCCQLSQSPAHRPADSRPAPAPAPESRPAAVLSRPCHIDQIQTVYNVGVVALPVPGCVPHHRWLPLNCQTLPPPSPSSSPLRFRFRFPFPFPPFSPFLCPLLSVSLYLSLLLWCLFLSLN